MTSTIVAPVMSQARVETGTGMPALRDLISLSDLSTPMLEAIFQRAIALKRDRVRAAASSDPADKPLRGLSVALIFEKPSLRTRVTFEVGITELGGYPVYLSSSDIQLGVRESVADVARNLDRWVHMIVARTFAHQTVLDLATYSSAPVINALTDFSHPCQGLADLLTIQEYKGGLRGRTLAFVGDGNNVLNSLLYGGSAMGMHLRVATPDGYAPNEAVVTAARQRVAQSGGSVTITTDPVEAVRGADAVYTDVWTSMGFESERTHRMTVFRPYQVNSALMKHARPDAIVLHCLPAHRGEEITDDVLDGPQSVVLDQAENRLHAQKAVMAFLAGH